ncbi:MAG: hypothetical protein ACOYD4_09460 [Solirubrobacterales bacterium]
MAVALLGLITVAGLGLVLLFSQTSVPIPSLGPVTEPLGGRQAATGGIAFGAAGAPRAGLVSTGSAPVPSASPALQAGPLAAADFAAFGGPHGNGGIGATAGEGAGVAGNEQNAAVQPQPTAVGPTLGPASAPEPGGGGGGGESAPAAEPVSEPVSSPPPAGPGVPTSAPPIVEPEAPQPPLEETPEGEAPEEPPVVEPPAEEQEVGGLLEAAVEARAAH